MWEAHVILDKQLIVNADDLGIDSRINEGIAYACRFGIVRSVSIVAGGRKFDEGLSLLSGLRGIGIGVHLCLVAEKPVLHAGMLPSLVDGQGMFLGDHRRFILKWLTGRIDLAEVELELEAQIRKVQGHGVKPTHLDSHQYIHLIPEVLEIVIRLAVKHDIRWVRYPEALRNPGRVTGNGFLKKAWSAWFAKAGVQQLDRARLRHPDHSYAVDMSGHLNKAVLMGHLRHMEEGVNDLTCHPGYFPESPAYRGWRYGWEEEMKSLADPEVASLVDALKIGLGNYAH
jgi:predicted glycoside hydrolase/deacetylase ChbG (UPF0249 family)